MKEAEDIHLENLQEALKQYDNYLRLAIAASLTYTLISFADRSKNLAPTNISVPLVPLPVSYPTLALLAVGALFVLGLLVSLTLDAINRALEALANNPQVFRAAIGYPSFATARLTGFRLLVVLTSPVLYGVSVFVGNWQSTRHAPMLVFFGFLIIAVPYLILALFIWSPLDSPGRYKNRLSPTKK